MLFLLIMGLLFYINVYLVANVFYENVVYYKTNSLTDNGKILLF